MRQWPNLWDDLLGGHCNPGLRPLASLHIFATACPSLPAFCFHIRALLAAELDSFGRGSCLSTPMGVTRVAIGWPQYPLTTLPSACFLLQGLLAVELDSPGRRSCLLTPMGVTRITVGWPSALISVSARHCPSFPDGQAPHSCRPHIHFPPSSFTPRYGRRRLVDCLNAAEPCHQPAQNPCPIPDGNKASKA